MASKYQLGLLLLCYMLIDGFIYQTTNADQVQLQMPNSKRTEGRVTLEYIRQNETIKYQLAFSEVIDTETKRSKISIGYISYDPKVYHGRDNNMLMLDKIGRCVNLRQSNYKFVPELDWFFKLTYTQAELESRFPAGKEHHIGPSGIVLMLARYTKFDHVETHRNVECQVTSANYSRSIAQEIVYEVLVPSLKMFDGPKMNVFSIRETVKNAVTNTGEKFSTIMTVDFYYSEEIDKTNSHQLDRFETDLNLPFGAGCSEYLSPIMPQTGTQSFIMIYRHSLAQSLVSLAYDHNLSYLRKELVGRSVSIWDLNEDLLYHVDLKLDGKLYNNVDIEQPTELCSVLSVENRNRSGNGEKAGGQISLPYSQRGTSIDVLEFLGAKKIYYIGQSRVRDLPCNVFETILIDLPQVFEVDLHLEQPDETQSFDYIIQYHIFKTNTDRSGRIANGNGTQSSIAQTIINDQFWPAQINLLKRYKKSGQTLLVDQLDIDNFHWDLFGWSKKPSELFMLPECFNSEDEQLRIDLSLEFEQIDETELKALRHSKYKLEMDLLNDLFKSFQISRMHLTEFELNLTPNNIVSNLVISDRIEDKRLTYFGVGDLPNANSYINNRIILQDLAEHEFGSETACIMLASHVYQVTMVIYCPRRSESQGPTCTAIFGESQPVVKTPTDQRSGSSPSDPFAPSTLCQVYRFEPRDPPKSATRDPDRIRSLLTNHKFNFQTSGSSKITLKGMIQDFDVTKEMQLICVNNYKFTQPVDISSNNEDSTNLSNVRAFETISYNNLGDCIKMCNLDAKCKSFSYCQDKTSNQANKCLLSSLDLRQNNIENQLVTTQLIGNNQVLVHDFDALDNRTRDYYLDLKSGCNIYERNFLSAFTSTDEVLRIESGLAKHFVTKPSASECARWVQSLEEHSDEHHSAMFAFCANSNTCLVDEDLFKSISNSTSQHNENVDDPSGLSNDLPSDRHELSCKIYRKRYQNYFHISPRVISRTLQGDADDPSSQSKSPIKQVEIQYNTVEQCARACWDSFGHICVSFDYCATQNCLLNLLNVIKGDETSWRSSMNDNIEFETRTGCLHYERDLTWDKLRRDHLIGRHKTLDIDLIQTDSSDRREIASNFALIIVTSALFIIGLAIGRVMNDRLENVGFKRRCEPNNATGSLSSTLRFTSSTSNRNSSNIKCNIENEIYEDPDAISLQNFGQNGKAIGIADGQSKAMDENEYDDVASGSTVIGADSEVENSEDRNLFEV